jgi:WD40 repeat protein
VSGSRDRSIKIWNVGNSTLIKTLNAHTSDVLCMLTAPSKGYLVTGSADHTIKVWSLGIQQCIQTLTGHNDNVTCLDFFDQSNSELLVSGSIDKSIRLWSLRNGECLARLEDDSRIRCLRLVPSVDLLVTGSSVNLKLWRLVTDNQNKMSGELVKVIDGHMDTVFDIKLIADLNLVTCSGDGAIKYWKF